MGNEVVPVDQIQQYLEDRQDRIKSALPAATDLTPGRVVRLVLTEMRKNPALMKCRVPSLLASMIQAAQLGLEPGSGRGLAYLVPYAGECTLIIGYRGFIELAERSGKVGQIMARVVRESDEFHVEFTIGQGAEGQVEHIRHVPDFSAAADEKIKAVYAYAQRTNGTVVVDVMSRDEVEAIRKRSKAKDSGPWQTDYNEMARKTVVRRLTKYLPLSPELERAVTVDEAAERGEPASDYLEGDWSDLGDLDPGDGEAGAEPGTGTERARQAVTGARKKAASKKKASSKKKATAARESAQEPSSPEGGGSQGSGEDDQEPPAGATQAGDDGFGLAPPGEQAPAGGGPSDSEIVQRIQRTLPAARSNGDLDTIADLESEASEIANEQWKEHCRSELQAAREAVETGAT